MCRDSVIIILWNCHTKVDESGLSVKVLKVIELYYSLSLSLLRHNVIYRLRPVGPPYQRALGQWPMLPIGKSGPEQDPKV